MDGSRVIQSLDSLWFFTNIFTCRVEPVASFIPPKTDFQKPNTPFLPNESQNVENLTPGCHDHKFGEISSTFEEVRGNSETVKSRKETEKRDRRKRRKLRLNDLGFDVKECGLWGVGERMKCRCLVGGFLRFEEKSYKYEMLSTQQQRKMPPFEDDVAMKQHLKSWAYAVACVVE